MRYKSDSWPVKNYGPCRGGRNPAVLATQPFLSRHRFDSCAGGLSDDNLFRLAITPGCQLINDMHDVARKLGDEWLLKVPDGDFVLSDSSVPVRTPFLRFVHSSMNVTLLSPPTAARPGRGKHAGVAVCCSCRATAANVMLSGGAGATAAGRRQPRKRPLRGTPSPVIPSTTPSHHYHYRHICTQAVSGSRAEAPWPLSRSQTMLSKEVRRDGRISQGEGEVKVFSALRTRHSRDACARHSLVCGDGDAVVMALMLPATASVRIDFGRRGFLDLSDLRTAWALNGMRRAGVPPWPAESAVAAAQGNTAQLLRPRWPRLQEFPSEQMDGVLRVRAARGRCAVAVTACVLVAGATVMCVLRHGTSAQPPASPWALRL